MSDCGGWAAGEHEVSLNRSDFHYRETSLTLHRHRFTLENLTNLDALPTTGAWIIWGGPRNQDGSGAPSTVFGLIP